MFDVAVIGGGVIGGMIARELSRYNCSVVILEKENDVAMGASKANSGIVHAGFDAVPGTKKALFNVKGSQMMPQIANELDVPYINNGAVVVADNQESFQIIKELYERGVKNGVDRLSLLSADELFSLEPNINGIGALYAPTSAIVCPYELTVAAIGNAMDNGAELITDFCVDSVEDNGQMFLIHSGIQTVSARYIVNAAGVYADKIARILGDDYFSITARKGEYMLLDRDCKDLLKLTVFNAPGKMGKGILVSPTTHGNIILGPTAEDILDKSDTSTTADGLAKIKKSAEQMVNNIPFGKVITSFCGLRSTPDRDDFIIEHSRSNGRLIHVAGIESPGLSSSPAIAVYVANLLAECGLSLSQKENFNPYRQSPRAFSRMSDDEKNEIIKKDSRYGHIICRCESVTEGEMVKAIKQNPGARNIDAIKRRTRGGMGRCQGGFCMPLVSEILARELNIPLTEITKCGGSSKILAEKTKEATR